jgi:hypothetical protein
MRATPAPPRATPAPAPAPPNSRATPLLPILALMNGSALLAPTLLVVWPATFTLSQQAVALLSIWLLVNLLAVVLVRLIDSGRSGAASVDVSKDRAALRVSVARNDGPPAAPRRQ